MQQEISAQLTFCRRELLEMYASLAFVEQGICRAWGGFFRPCEKCRGRAVIPRAEFAQALRKSASGLRKIGNDPSEKCQKRREHTES